MPFWKEPELPPLQVPPPARKAKGPSFGVRLLAAVAAVAFGIAALFGLRSALSSTGRDFGSFGPLALLIPTVMLLRYAIKGEIKPL